MIALVLLAALAVQDSDVDALLKQLADESIEVREKASARLLALGDPAAERLRKELATAKGEFKARLEGVLQSIDRQRKLRSLLPSAKRVTLSMKDAAISDVILQFRKQTGWQIQGHLPEGSISIDLRDLPPFEALDAIGRAMNRGYGALPAAGQSEAIGFSGPFASVPRVPVRGYSVSLTDLQLVKRNDFTEVRVVGQLTVRVEWPPMVKPHSMGRFTVEKIIDDQDQVLFDHYRVRGLPVMSGGDIDDFSSKLTVGFKYPDAKSRALKSVKGLVTVRYPIEERVATFADPAASEGKSQTIDGREVTLKSFREEGSKITAVLIVKGVPPRPAEEMDAASGFGGSDVRLKLGGALGPGWHFSSESWEDDVQTLILETTRTGKGAASIEVVVDRVFHDDSFEYELKDIPLPK